MNCFEQGDEFRALHKGRRQLDYLSKCQLLRRDSAPSWRSL